MAMIAMRKKWPMRSVNVAELKNRLSKYPTFAKGGEEVVIRDGNLPVAKLVPFSAEGAGDQELVLVAAGKLRLPKVRLDVEALLKIPTGSVAGNKAIQAVLADREEV
jgi:antitoxin (DNA-binding transcriptional repressor) of toxin-antitoxin stability system